MRIRHDSEKEEDRWRCSKEDDCGKDATLCIRDDSEEEGTEGRKRCSKGAKCEDVEIGSFYSCSITWGVLVRRGIGGTAEGILPVLFGPQLAMLLMER